MWHLKPDGRLSKDGPTWVLFIVVISSPALEIAPCACWTGALPLSGSSPEPGWQHLERKDGAQVVQLSRMNNGIKSAGIIRISPIVCADVCLKSVLELKFSLNSGFYYYLF